MRTLPFIFRNRLAQYIKHTQAKTFMVIKHWHFCLYHCKAQQNESWTNEFHSSQTAMAKVKERARSSTSFVHHQIKKFEATSASNALWLAQCTYRSLRDSSQVPDLEGDGPNDTLFHHDEVLRYFSHCNSGSRFSTKNEWAVAALSLDLLPLTSYCTLVLLLVVHKARRLRSTTLPTTLLQPEGTTVKTRHTPERLHTY
jgi:hypothetical protein